MQWPLINIIVLFIFQVVPYEVSLYTGDVQNGGTDAEVYIKVFGSKGSTSEIKIDKMSDRFERGKIDLLKVSALFHSNAV